ncbi:MAG: hypothetical protein HC927_09275, partial [Deltaproteobacteria bacterium]|nr:hypothetical protein [Deltaproteobacteria bacterium]
MQGWAKESLLDELVRVPRHAFVRWPGTQVLERPGWMQIITPSFRRGGLNEVSFAALAEHEADAIIAETIATYRELGLRFRWTVAPDCRPSDLA